MKLFLYHRASTVISGKKLITSKRRTTYFYFENKEEVRQAILYLRISDILRMQEALLIFSFVRFD